ncbi:unnamed protein product [Aphanomyces euteiches]
MDEGDRTSIIEGDETTKPELPPAKINMLLIRKCMNLTRDSTDDEEASQLLLKTVLRLDWQRIGKIENLDVFSHIRELYLQHNLIPRIENLDFHDHLEFLALSHNQISKIENLSHLTKLKFLDLSYNKITKLDIEDELPPSLRVVRLAGNPLTESWPNYANALFDAFPLLTACDEYRRDGAASPTSHGQTMQHHVAVQSPIDAALSREEIKQQKERMSAHHASKMKEMNEGLAEERDQIVERSMRRMRERRKKLQQQTQTYLEEAASHVQSRHAEHASWRKAKLEGSSSA